MITYREKYLLYSPTLYSSRQKLHVATVVAHELAHQWFGNLVTMDWWNALWLNEGFATLMEYIGAAAISDGKFRMDEYFILDALTSAFDRDARATSHPLIFPIEKAEDVTEAFDSITYDKVLIFKNLNINNNILGRFCFENDPRDHGRTEFPKRSDHLFESIQI